jgi:purine-binding chemotaxis protein CheW
MSGLIDEAGEADGLMLCRLEADGQSFGIDTRRIREVLGVTVVQRVPLAPAFIAGMVSYRGEVLTTVSLRALLGMEPKGGPSCLLVLDGDVQWTGGDEQFGLMVDGDDLLANNPPPLGERLKRLYKAAYRVRKGLIVELDPERMRPGVVGCE